MTVKQKIIVGVAMFLLVVLLAGIIFYMQRPAAEPEGLLVQGQPSASRCMARAHGDLYGMEKTAGKAGRFMLPENNRVRACGKCAGGFLWQGR